MAAGGVAIVLGLAACATLLGIDEGQPMSDAASDADGCRGAAARVFRDTAVIQDGEVEPLQPISIPLCLPSKHSLLFFGVRHQENSPNFALVRGELADDGSLKFVRRGAIGEVQISWSVLEHPAISVQRNTEPLDTKVRAVEIAPIDPARAFAMISYSSGGANWSADHQISASFESSAILRLETRSRPTEGMVAWQVVELSDESNVTADLVDVAPDQAMVEVPIAAADPLRSILLFSYHATGDLAGTLDQWAFDGAIGDDGSTLRFTRATAGTGFRIAFFRVELASSFARVERRSVTLDTTYTSNEDFALTTTAGSPAVVFASARGLQGRLVSMVAPDAGSDASDTGSKPSSDVRLRLDLSKQGSAVLVSRGTAKRGVTAEVQVVSFPTGTD
jgi:hypothetical protein